MTKTVLERLAPHIHQVRARYIGKDGDALMELFARDSVSYRITQFRNASMTPVWADDMRSKPAFKLDMGNALDLRPRNGEFYNIWSQYMVGLFLFTTGQLIYRHGSYPGFELLGPRADHEITTFANMTKTRLQDWRVR